MNFLLPKPIVSLMNSWPMHLARQIIELVECWLSPLFSLAIRFYVASVFLRSGWLKISDWSTTLILFANEYHVPLLPPDVAAVLGTMGEVGLPILLVLGLAGRFGAAGLSVVNVIAAISFPDISDLGIQDHIWWGTMLLVIVFHGPGTLSVDYLLARFSKNGATIRSNHS